MAEAWASGKRTLPGRKFLLLRPPRDGSGRSSQGSGCPLRYPSRWVALVVGPAVSAVGSSGLACIPPPHGPGAS